MNAGRKAAGRGGPPAPPRRSGPACRPGGEGESNECVRPGRLVERARAAVLRKRALHGPPARGHDRGEPGPDGGAGGRPRGAGRVRHGPPVQLSATGRRGRRRARSGSTRSASARATGSASGRRTARSGSFVQYGTAKLGAILVNINPAYRTHELAYVLKQAGISVLVSAPEFKTSDYRAMVAEVRGDCPDLREVLFLGDPEWEQLLATGRAGDRGLLAAAGDASCRPTTRSTSSTPRGRRASPRARRSPTTTCSTTASSSARAAATPRPTGSASRCPTTTASAWAWATSAATSHGATMVIPAPGFDPALTLQAVQDETLHLAVRRPDDVHRRAGAAELRRLRPLHPAHRDHGRLAVPGGGDEAGGRRDGHGPR